MKQINYTGSSKLISRIVYLLNRKAPLPLDGDGDPSWGTNGQVLTTDGAGGTRWSSGGGGGGDTVTWTQTQASGTKIAEIDISGTSQNVYVPTVPTVNDGTLTIQQNGTTVGTFSANQSGNTTVNLTGGGSTYTAGDGINISSQNAISVDTAFTEASTRANIASGESFATILGKIKKWFTDIPNMFVSKSGGAFNGGIGVDKADGTTETIGNSSITLGNNIPEGTLGNSRGDVVIFGKDAYYSRLRSNASSASWINDLPDKNGTLATTDDIPTDFVSKANGGTFNGDVSFDDADGTTVTEGNTLVEIGNGKGVGVNGNSTGRLRIYSKTGHYINLYASQTASANRNIYFPDKGGTLALTSDIETKTVKSSTTPTYNAQIASEFASGNNDNLTLYTLSNGMRVMNGLFLVTATQAASTDKLFDIPSEYVWTHEGYSNQYWLVATNVSTKESYTIRITSAAYPWGSQMPAGTYLIHAVF